MIATLLALSGLLILFGYGFHLQGQAVAARIRPTLQPCSACGKPCRYSRIIITGWHILAFVVGVTGVLTAAYVSLHLRTLS